MNNNKKAKAVFIGIALIAVLILFSACSGIGEAADPADLGYPYRVTYHALGGTINLKNVRTTYYAEDSYIFKPSGSSNMLVEPVREGYILAGWYTAKEDITDENGTVTGYAFQAEDRWDFDEDRISGDIDLYARWIPQSAVQYIDADTGKVLFTKNVTADSPVQPLSSSVEKLYTPAGKTLLSYYFDKECTQQCAFEDLSHEDLLLSNELIYAKLSEKFPEYIVPLNQENRAENPVGGGTTADTDGSYDPYLFIENAGYHLKTTEKSVLEEIRAEKDALIEHSIATYLENSNINQLYMKFIDGNYIRVSSAASFKSGARYSFSNLSTTEIDGYIFTSDIDFGGAVFETASDFKGAIYGNGYTLRNFRITAGSKKIPAGQVPAFGLFENLSGAVINDLHFESVTVNINPASNGSLYAALLAGKADHTSVTNCNFTNIKIKTGMGETPVPYQPPDGGICYAGDLFAAGSENTVEGCRAENCLVSVTGNVEINTLLFSKE
ncbi:MAG: InlB B-repeat-containing protein [Clostridia bacterium]